MWISKAQSTASVMGPGRPQETKNSSRVHGTTFVTNISGERRVGVPKGAAQRG
jgi:hypothetical protein